MKEERLPTPCDRYDKYNISRGDRSISCSFGWKKGNGTLVCPKPDNNVCPFTNIISNLKKMFLEDK